ncbi:MAG: hypothetical protein AAF593_00320 [Planctomycetota bacterium]
MVKLHVVADLCHLLQFGEPLIGGQPAAWRYGPVVQDAFITTKRWAESGGEFRLLQRRGKACELIPDDTNVPIITLDPAAQYSIDQAWDIYDPLDGFSTDSQEFFHKPDHHFGRAWTEAYKDGQGTAIGWDKIIKAYDDINGTDHSHVLRLIQSDGDDEFIEKASEAYRAPDSFWADT